MSSLIRIPFVAGALMTVPCPIGHLLRIMSIVGVCSPAADLDTFSILFARSNEILCQIQSPFMVPSQTRYCAAIGLGRTEVVAAQFNPATGIYSFDQSMVLATVALPAIQWPHEINVSAAMDQGSLGTGSLYYELVRL